MNISNVATAPAREVDFPERVFDLAKRSLRELNQALHQLTPGSNETAWEVLNPKGS
ncbi:MAG: protein GlxC, partial [Mesorhizobium sp.]